MLFRAQLWPERVPEAWAGRTATLRLCGALGLCQAKPGSAGIFSTLKLNKVSTAFLCQIRGFFAWLGARQAYKARAEDEMGRLNERLRALEPYGAMNGLRGSHF